MRKTRQDPSHKAVVAGADVAATTSDPTLSLERREMALLVSQAVERLPAAEREAVILFYFEGYAGDDAARFLDIPVGIPPRQASRRPYPTPPAADQDARDSRRPFDRARAPAGARAGAAFDRRVPGSMVPRRARTPLTRPIPLRLCNLLSRVSISKADGDSCNRMLTRPEGPLLDDPRPAGEAARVLRAALGTCEDWVMDGSIAVRAFPHLLRRDPAGRPVGMGPAVMPPALLSGRPGRYVRVTRGLLFDDDAAGVMDPAKLLVRVSRWKCSRKACGVRVSATCSTCIGSSRGPSSCLKSRPWITGIASQLVPRAETRCSAQAGPRYRSALRLTFQGDPRPAAIGGVLASWPGHLRARMSFTSGSTSRPGPR